MARAKLFRNNRSQAVRLPKAVAFPDDVKEVEVTEVGQSRLITPVSKSWDDLFDRGPRVSEDFMVDREQQEKPEEREPF